MINIWCYFTFLLLYSLQLIISSLLKPIIILIVAHFHREKGLPMLSFLHIRIKHLLHVPLEKYAYVACVFGSIDYTSTAFFLSEFSEIMLWLRLLQGTGWKFAKYGLQLDST